MGSGIRKRYGQWYVRYTDVHGVRREVVVNASTATEAKEKLGALRGQVRDQKRGLWDGDDKATVASVYAKYEKTAKRLGNWRTVEMWFRLHILPELGHQRLRMISKGTVEALLGKKADAGLSPRTLEHIRMRISVLFNWATEEGIYRGDNPAAKMGAVSVPTKPPVYLEAHHVQPVLDCADERWRNLFALAVYCGLRLGEFRALTTRDVDLVNRLIRVWKSGGNLSTKTGKFRLVPVPLAAMSYLMAQLARAEEGGFLFTGEDGKQLPASTQPAKPLRRALARAGLSKLYPGLRFHDLRKTFGTHFYEASGDLTAAARLMGHSPEVAEAIYVGASARRMGALADRMDFKKLPPIAPTTVVGDSGTDVQASAPPLAPSEED